MSNEHDTKTDNKTTSLSKSQLRSFIVVLTLGTLFAVYHILTAHKIANSAALYIGLPLLLALGLSLTPQTKTTIGGTLKWLTIAIFLSAIILREGFICILFAAPILYSIAALVALLISLPERRRRKEKSVFKVPSTVAIAIIALSTLEGTSDKLSFERNNEVSVSKIINASTQDIRQQLTQTPSFTEPRPLFVKIFPMPTKISGNGLAVGDQRVLNFSYKRWIVSNTQNGTATFAVGAANDHYIRFDLTEDNSYISHYLTWQSSEVYLDPIDANKTKVTWTLKYKRELDPMWYFGPLQNYAVKLTARTLIDNVANPRY